MGGDVFEAHIRQRVAVGAVGAVAHHGAHVALGMVVLAFGETVVHQYHHPGVRAAQHALGQAVHKGLCLGVELGEVVVLTVNVQRWPQLAGPVLPSPNAFCAGCSGHHAALMPLALAALQQLNRHGVDDLIADHHTVHHIGPLTEPLHFVGMGMQHGLLALAQGARQLDDGVALHRIAQAVEQLQRQVAGAGAKLPDGVATGVFQGLAHRLDQGAAKPRAQGGGGDKVAARWICTDESVLSAVIAQAWGIQGQGHEAVKAQPAAGTGHGALDQAL